MKKIILSLALLISILTVSTSADGETTLKSAKFATDTKLQIFGKTIETEIVAAEKAGVDGIKNYVSARDLAEYLGYQVNWDGDKKIISVDTYAVDGKDLPTTKEIEELKPQVDKIIEQLLSKFSTRELDSLRKEIAILQRNVSNDPMVLVLLLAEDYRIFKSGGESNFDYVWKDMDK